MIHGYCASTDFGRCWHGDGGEIFEVSNDHRTRNRRPNRCRHDAGDGHSCCDGVKDSSLDPAGCPVGDRLPSES